MSRLGEIVLGLEWMDENCEFLAGKLPDGGGSATLLKMAMQEFQGKHGRKPNVLPRWVDRRVRGGRG